MMLSFWTDVKVAFDRNFPLALHPPVDSPIVRTASVVLFDSMSCTSRRQFTSPQDCIRASDVLDPLGHGVLMASYLLASSACARVRPVRCIDDDGRGDVDELVRAVDQLVDSGAVLFCFGLCTQFVDDMRKLAPALIAAEKAGVFSVAALPIGPRLAFPASFPNVIACTPSMGKTPSVTLCRDRVSTLEVHVPVMQRSGRRVLSASIATAIAAGFVADSIVRTGATSQRELLDQLRFDGGTFEL
jgi:hypothetical protein